MWKKKKCCEQLREPKDLSWEGERVKKTSILIAILGTTSNNDSIQSTPPPSPEPQDPQSSQISSRNFMPKSQSLNSDLMQNPSQNPRQNPRQDSVQNSISRQNPRISNPHLPLERQRSVHDFVGYSDRASRKIQVSRPFWFLNCVEIPRHNWKVEKYMK